MPAIREWTDANGSFEFTASSRIVVNTPQLIDEARTFADDLSIQFGRTVAVISGAPASGDVQLALGGAVPAEGYTLTIGAVATVAGSDEAGAFYGTRTLLQLLHQSTTVGFGVARDWPAKPERGLMIDQGRKFFTVDWIRRHLKELAYLKLNYLHLHLSDTLGFRLESTSHPELTSPEYYSKQDIAEIVALAARYKIVVVPEIDFPGHMNTTLKAHPELRLRNFWGGYSASEIDLSLDASYTLIRDLIEEYLPLFPGPYWHLGADEYVANYADYPQLLTYARAHYGSSATAKDTFYGFVNWANGIVRAAGKTMRMWNDGIKHGDGTINPAPDIIVEHWYNFGLTPSQLLSRGHTIANASWDATYYTTGGPTPAAPKPDSPWIYSTWQPDLFHGGTTITTPGRNLGSLLHVWRDNPDAETEDQITSGISYPLRTLAQRMWGSPKPSGTFYEFSVIAGAAGHTPGWQTTVYTLSVSGKAVDDPVSSTVPGTQMVLWTLHGGLNQQWRVTPRSEGSVTVVNQFSGLCLDVAAGSLARGAPVIQWSCTGNDNQRWILSHGKIMSVKSGLLLTATSTVDGAKLVQQVDTGSALQRWTLIGV